MGHNVIITAALTGSGRATKEHNPHIPESPQEIAEAAYKCWQAGAAVAHIHGRDWQGNITVDPAVYKETYDLIREKCDIILQVSTGLGAYVATEDRIKVLESKPEMASLNMGTMVRTGWDDSIFLNTPKLIQSLVSRMLDLDIKPELEVFSHPMVRDVEALIKGGLIKKPYVVNLVLGASYQNTLDATPRDLLSLINYLPPDCHFTVTAMGRQQLPLTTLGMLMGGNVRVGLEDNLYYKKGQLASNELLVERAVRIARELQIEVATPTQARETLGLKTL